MRKENMNRMCRQVILILALCVISYSSSYAQRFSASVLVGSNFAQIDGDDLAGFNKLGLSAGILTEYEIKSNRILTVELLYNQTGSKSALSFGRAPGVEYIALSYVDIPVLFRINDWEIDDTYHKVFIEAGLSLGRLINAEVDNSFFEGLETDFTKTKLNFALGGGLRFNRHLGFNVRYSRSINSLYENERLLARSLFGYFLTFRLEYKL